MIEPYHKHCDTATIAVSQIDDRGRAS